jgi:hypothetical protein
MVSARVRNLDGFDLDEYEEEPGFQRMKSTRQKSYSPSRSGVGGNGRRLRPQRRPTSIALGIQARGSKRGTFRCDRVGKVRFTALPDVIPSETTA